MDTIQAYVDNVFRTLPTTKEILRAKEEILGNMIDKYNELKQSGKSEHEAVGIVISEFGNIDELLEEMNLTPEAAPTTAFTEEAPATNDRRRLMALTEVENYLTAYEKAARQIALGVALIILGVSVLILLGQLGEDRFLSSGLITNIEDSLGVVALFLFVAAGVALFIIHGMRLSKYNYVTEGIRLDPSTTAFIETKRTELQPSFTRNLVLGVLMCVISPLIIVIGELLISEDSSYPVVAFLCFIALAVYLLVSNGVRYGSMTTLLENAKKSTLDKKSDNLTGTFCGTIMLVATAIYLYFGFVQDNWDYAPVIYAIGGILCGISAIVINGIKETKK